MVIYGKILSYMYAFTLQLLHDMVAVNEATGWETRSSVEAKYRALRCHIVPLSNDTVEYAEVMSLVKTTPKV